MNIILLIIFIAIFVSNKKDRKNSDLFKTIFKAYMLITVASWFISSPVIWIIAIGLIVLTAVKKTNDKQEKQKRHQQDYEQMKRNWEERKRQQENGQSGQQGTYRQGSQTGQQGTYQQTSQKNAGYTGQASYSTAQKKQNGQGTYSYGQSASPYTASKILPKPLLRRKKIIGAFNDRYDLSLTEEEIRRIAEASYVSEAWKREVEAMTARYETEGQWFVGPTDWLRVYIYAFELQNISSDFGLQEQICFETLDEVMAYACAYPDATVQERVDRVNERYFTRFNEMSFMITYRFLQRKGRHYDLSRPDLVKNVDQELEEAMKKYKAESGTEGRPVYRTGTGR